MNRLPGGFWPIMITPFTDQGKLDLSGIRRILDMYLMAGARGIFTNCLSGEMYYLTREERLELANTVVRHINGRVPVVATGTFLPDLQNNIEFIRMIYQEGVNAVVLITSILAEPAEGEESLKSRILDIMDQTEKIPLGTYECPVPYKRLLSPELMGGLSETGRFFYHKDTSCDPALIKNKLDKIRGSNFQLYNADTPTALNSLRDGAMGLSPIAGNFYPELVTYLIRLFESRNLQTLKSLNSRLTIMDRVAHDFYPLSAKVFLKKRGLKIGIQTRIPVPDLTPQYKNTLEALLHFFEQMMDEYGLETVI